MEKEYIMIITTTDSVKEAEIICDTLLEKRLVACCQKINIASKYHWKGEIESADEIMIIMKTKKSLYKEVEEEILKLHSYDTPDITCLDIKDGLNAYLKWIEDETK